VALVWAAAFAPPPPAQASPLAVYAIGCEFLAASIDGDADDLVTIADFATACDGLSPAEAAAIESVLGDGDGFWNPGELDAVEFDANQLRDGIAPLPRGLYVFILVDDDDDVVVDSGQLGPDATCASLTGTLNDEDCDGDGVIGDGLLVHAIGDATGPGGALEPGDVTSVDVTQEAVEVGIGIDVVGEPDAIFITALKTSVEMMVEPDSCDDIDPFNAVTANEDTDKVAVFARVDDSNNVPLTRIVVDFESDTPAALNLAEDQRSDGAAPATTAATVDDSTFPVPVAAAVFCGQDTGGPVTIMASFDDGQSETEFVDITVFASADHDGDGTLNGPDNCPFDFNPAQENTDNVIGNGPGIPGDDATSPNGDVTGDACDTDDDNDGWLDTYPPSPPGPPPDPHPRGDTTYDDDGDGNPMLGCFGGTDAGDDGPSWDGNCDGERDGAPRICGPIANDADFDGLIDAWETCKWGTSNSSSNSDGDALGDCTEAMDVNGNGLVNGTDAVFVAQAAFGVIGRDGAFDINGNALISNADAVFVWRAFFNVTPCA
jgi:hypothetical protein